MNPFNDTDVYAMERAAAHAWPAARVNVVGGWDVRLSGGGSRRANSVLPLDFESVPLSEAFSQVEAQYRAQRTRSYFQVIASAKPVDLDAQLAARGYDKEEPCLLLAKALAPAPMPDDVDVTAEPTAEWLAVFTETMEAVRCAALPGVLANVPQKHAYLLVRRAGVPITTALAVVPPGGIAVVECVATRTTVQRSGGGQTVMAALEAWASANGARIAALQVVADNTPARKLYERRGYVEVSRYHYRWKDVG